MANQTEARDLHIPGQQADLFDMIDRNHDGVITQSEMNAAVGQQTQPAIGGLQAPSLPMPSLGQSAFGMTAPGFATTPPVRLTTPPPMQTQVLQAPMVQAPQSPIGTTAFVQAASPQASATIMQPGMSGSFSPPPAYAMSVQPAAVSTIQPAVTTMQPGVSTYQTNAPMQSQMQVQQGMQMGSFVQPVVQMGQVGSQMPQLSGARFMP